MVDCGKKSLAEAVRDVKDANQTITFTGVCSGPLVIAIDGLTLKGEGTAIIDGSGVDVVTISGASRVALLNLEVTNGGVGIVAQHGAHVQLTDVNSHDNAGSGIVVRSASTVVLTWVQRRTMAAWDCGPSMVPALRSPAPRSRTMPFRASC
jgi:hypothetical protein